MQVSARLNRTTLTCDRTSYSFEAAAPESIASVSLVLGDVTLEPADITIYKCSVLGSHNGVADCAVCATHAAASECAWCSGKCTHRYAFGPLVLFCFVLLLSLVLSLFMRCAFCNQLELFSITTNFVIYPKPTGLIAPQTTWTRPVPCPACSSSGPPGDLSREAPTSRSQVSISPDKIDNR